MTLTHLDLDRIDGLARRLRESKAEVLRLLAKDAGSLKAASVIAGWIWDTDSALADLTALIAYTRELEGALEPLLAAAEGLSHGEDWNNGTHAKHHKYRQKLLDAIAPARTALQRKTP